MATFRQRILSESRDGTIITTAYYTSAPGWIGLPVEDSYVTVSHSGAGYDRTYSAAYFSFDLSSISRQATITAAHLTVMPALTNYYDGPYGIRGRATWLPFGATNAIVSWPIASNGWSQGIAVTSPDIKAIIQEMLAAAPEGTTEFPLIFGAMAADSVQANYSHVIVNYGNSQDNAAQIEITYTAPEYSYVGGGRITFGGAAVTGTGNGSNGPSLTGWPAPFPVAIRHDHVSSDLTDQQVLIRITDHAAIGALCRADGFDVRITDAAGSLLPIERVAWSVTSGSATGLVWVRIPTLSATADTTVYLFVGNSSAADVSSPAAVWGGTGGYAGAWHLDETSGSLADATGNSNNGTANGSPTHVAGVAGNGLQFASGDYVNLGAGTSLRITSTISIEIWLNITTVAESTQRILGRCGSYDYLFEMAYNHPSFTIYGNAAYTSYSTSLTANSWHRIGITYSDAANEIRFYLDGTLTETVSCYASITTSSVNTQLSDSWLSIRGTADEPRVFAGIHSAARQRFEFYNQRPATDGDITIGSQLSAGPVEYSYIGSGGITFGGSADYSLDTRTATSTRLVIRREVRGLRSVVLAILREVRTAPVSARFPILRRVFLPDRLHVMARDVATGQIQELGVAAPQGSSSLQLQDVALSPGTYEVWVERDSVYWPRARRGAVQLLTVADGHPPVVDPLPTAVNLAASVVQGLTLLTWSASRPIVGDADGKECRWGLWFGLSSPVSVAGQPSITVPVMADQITYRTIREQTAAEWLAVALVGPDGERGESAELWLPWSTETPVSPENQTANVT